MYYTKSRTVNNVVKEHDGIVNFLSPIGKGQDPFTHIKTPILNGVLTSDGNNNATANSNLIFDGFVLDLSGSITVNGSITTTGTIVPQRYTSGQTVKTTILSRSEINQVITMNSSNISFIPVATYQYTPVISSSKIIVEYFTTYSVGGNSTDATDSFTSAIYINGTINVNGIHNDGTPIAKGFQQWVDVSGGATGTGTRSGTIFPLLGAYTNDSTDSMRIYVLVKQSNGNDTITIYGDEGTWLKITEIAL